MNPILEFRRALRNVARLCVLGVISANALAQNLECGQTVQGVIAAPDTPVVWTFSGQAGEVVTVRSQWVTEGASHVGPWLVLHAPNGDILGRNAPQNSYDSLIGNVLPVSGTYSVLVSGDGVAGYDLNLQFLTGRCAPTLGCGETVTGAFARATEQQVWTFSGQAGEVVTLRARWVTEGASHVGPWLSLHAPNGDSLGRNAPQNSYDSLIGNVLPVSGTYSVLVSGDGVAGYDLNLQYLTGRCAPTLGCGETVTGAFARATEQQVWTFSGQAGEVVTLRARWVTEGASHVGPWLSLHAPNGDSLGRNAPQNSYDSLIGNVLPVSGTYSVLVSGDGVAGYDLNLQFLTGRCAPTLGCGETVTGAFARATEQQVWTFSGQAGEVVTVRSQWVTEGASHVGPWLVLHAPNGDILGRNAPQNSYDSLIGNVLPVSGTYSVLVSGDGVAGYDLNLQFLTGRCAPTLGCGETVTGAFARATEQQVWTFSGQAGEVVTLRARWVTEGASHVGPWLSLHAPNGDSLGRNAPQNSYDSLIGNVLPVSGTYSVLVSGDGVAGYDLNLQFLTGRCAPTLDCGETVTGAFARATEQQVWTFSGQAGEVVTLRARWVTEGASHVGPWLSLHAPNGDSLGRNAPQNSYDSLIGNVLPVSGTYSVLVSGDGVAGYDLNLQFLTGRCAVALERSSPVDATLAKAVELDAWRLSLVAGDSIRIRATSPGWTPLLAAYTPLGVLIRSGASEIGPIVMTQSEDLVVLVGAPEAQSGDYRLTVEHDLGLRVTRSGAGPRVEWSVAAAELQQADAVVGPWETVAGAASPHPITPDRPARFYRLALDPPSSETPALARQSGLDLYLPGGLLPMTNTLAFGGTLLSLGWEPVLPAGWRLETVTGPGSPEINSQGTGVVWRGAFPPSPIEWQYTVQVPTTFSGPAFLGGRVDYQILGMTNPASVVTLPDPLVVRPGMVSHGLTREWDRSLGDGFDTIGRGVAPTADGGFLAVGYARTSAEPDSSRPLGDDDAVAAFVTSSGDWVRELRWGGLLHDYFFAVAPAEDGGFLLAGCSESAPGGNKTSPHWGEMDYWVVRIDAAGARLWEASYGGTGRDWLESVTATADGGFLLVGFSESGISGNKTSDNFGPPDLWMVRIDAVGAKRWERGFGGSRQDFGFFGVQETRDRGFILAGSSHSGVSGNKETAVSVNEQSDVWILRLDAEGHKIWEKSLGGVEADGAVDVVELDDGGYAVLAASTSEVGGNKSAPHHGGHDFWVIRLDRNGEKLWDRSYGGGGADVASALGILPSGDWVVAGTVASGPAAVGLPALPSLGGDDYWILLLNPDGQPRQELRLGGSEGDVPYDLAVSPEGRVAVVGRSNSPPGAGKEAQHHGQAGRWDFWMVAVRPDP